MLSIYSIIGLIIILFVVLFYASIVYCCFCNQKLKYNNNIIYIIIILSIIGFIGLFIWYNEKSINIYNEELTKINNMFYMNYYDTNSTISNHNEINKRIIFLEERVAHYQNNSNNFASLWLALLSVLFITVTGFNLYNFNENKKNLEKIIKEGEDSVGKINKKINEVESLRVEIAESNNNSLKKQNDKIEDGEGNNV